MNRRDLLIGAGVAVLGSAAHAAGSDDKGKGKSATTAAAHHHEATPYSELAAAAADCLGQGEACLDHCFKLLAQGDTSLAQCGAAVRNMLATCNALLTLANSSSAQVKDMARVASAVARACEVECRKHESIHPTCKACAEACARLIAAQNKLPT